MDEKNLIEAALFAAGGPVTEAQLKSLLNRSSTYMAPIIDKLIEEYRLRHSPLEIVKLEGKYVMQLKAEYSASVMSISPKELTSPVLRTLSIIAYYQPIMQNELVNVRGQATYDHVTVLEERGLIEKRKNGRTYEITTTDAFCDYFGLTPGDVESIKKQIKNKAKFKKESLTKWIESGVPDINAFNAVKRLVPVMNKNTDIK
ncbi:SMC-Scp complex subunit ScpB [Methanocella sp. CWC-04]|uniref:SMC-Scp complex subunit ScpB n=1 Tax=Methanooceanicella nereidis TaxID=2052831 RepID=A0AAP2RAE5_9EURY|nr:SMC-Scp complex subunit ScpB [Methanocella sp. CWC-04]MCD1293693.1 SMC-Scp complex subunit ScpB [Methanocella sp. CWC-04]